MTELANMGVDASHEETALGPVGRESVRARFRRLVNPGPLAFGAALAVLAVWCGIMVSGSWLIPCLVWAAEATIWSVLLATDSGRSRQPTGRDWPLVFWATPSVFVLLFLGVSAVASQSMAVIGFVGGQIGLLVSAIWQRLSEA